MQVISRGNGIFIKPALVKHKTLFNFKVKSTCFMNHAGDCCPAFVANFEYIAEKTEIDFITARFEICRKMISAI